MINVQRALGSMIRRRYDPDTHPQFFKKDGTPDIEAFKQDKTASAGGFWAGFEKRAMTMGAVGTSLSSMKPKLKISKPSVKDDPLLPTPVRTSGQGGYN